jgi:uncharacterized coiled-coil protein SlyX
MSITNLIKGIETQYAQQEKEIIRLNKCLDARWNELEQKQEAVKKLRTELFVLNRNLKTILSIIETERKNKELTQEHKKKLLDTLQDVTSRTRQRALKTYKETNL